MKLHTQYKSSRPCGFRLDFFHVFPFISLCETCDRGWGNIWPQGHNLDKLGRDPLGDATCQISRLSALWFQTSFFSYFSYICLCDP